MLLGVIINIVWLQKQVTKVDYMSDTRDIVASIPPPLGTNAFAFGSEFLQVRPGLAQRASNVLQLFELLLRGLSRVDGWQGQAGFYTCTCQPAHMTNTELAARTHAARRT